MAGAFVVMIVPVVIMGYQITAPFLILGAVAVLGSTFVSIVFDRTRELANDE